MPLRAPGACPEATMTHTARFGRLAGVAFVSAALLASPALAQTNRTPDVGGVVRDYQTAPPTPPTRPLREGVTGLGLETQGAIREPRFIVEAVNFRAVDESGRTDAGSDEVFAVFESAQHSMITKTYGNVDTRDVETFDQNQSCIWPASDPDGTRNGAWACAPGGASGPVRFTITLLDEDRNWDAIVGGGIGFCIYTRNDDLSECHQDHHSMLFEHEFSYGVSEILGRLDPACRCFTETARHSQDHSTYEVTFRITRVDTGGEPLGVDRNPDSAGPVVHRSGTLTAPLMRGFEFDGGTVGVGGDVVFSRTLLAFFVTPNGGAKIWPGDAAARGYATCYAQRNSANYVTTMVASPTVGQHMCYVTNEGRVGEFRVESLMQGNNATLTVSYTTWQ